MFSTATVEKPGGSWPTAKTTGLAISQPVACSIEQNHALDGPSCGDLERITTVGRIIICSMVAATVHPPVGSSLSQSTTGLSCCPSLDQFAILSVHNAPAIALSNKSKPKGASQCDTL